MAMTVGDKILERLAEWGVHRVFGFPGDGINGLMSAFNHGDHGIRYVQVRHEEMAAFMACAHAKFTGEVGVCIATSGPGAIHLLNGLYDARMDHAPVVALVGQSARASMGADYQQEVDLTSLFKDVAREYCQVAMSPMQTRQLIDRAVRIAKAERTVTCVIFPKDVQELDAEKPPHQHGASFTGVGFTSPRVVPIAEDLGRAAEVLNAGKKVAMLVGAGCKGATDEVLEIADLLGAGVAKALLGKDVLPDDLPFVTGPIGLLGTKPSWNLMQDCDTLLMVGTSFPYSEFLPREGKARGVQIDLDGRMLSLRFPMEVNLCGDAKETLRALAPLLRKKPDRSWREKIADDNRAWWELMQSRAMGEAKPLNPQRVFWELSPLLPDRCILTADSGSSAGWYARDLKIRRGMQGSLSGTLATMGPAVPYAIAAKFAYPDRVVFALAGDGAMQMNGINELITISKYWKEWADPRLIVLVLNNRDLNYVTWEMRAMAGEPKLETSQDIPDFPYARYAESLGLLGVKMETPDSVQAGWAKALAADRPCVVEARVDPDVPPLPPHLTLKEAKAFASALLKGDPDTPGVIKQTLREQFSNLIGRKD
ncbi:MAG: thiamine pyrophosphate-requiring protein [Deltaproteobacteria bacterium]|nr:thiamine pyrophosphate-requiring protein [Deltaproteobacteria bacterium]